MPGLRSQTLTLENAINVDLWFQTSTTGILFGEASPRTGTVQMWFGLAAAGQRIDPELEKYLTALAHFVPAYKRHGVMASTATMVDLGEQAVKAMKEKIKSSVSPAREVEVKVGTKRVHRPFAARRRFHDWMSIKDAADAADRASLGGRPVGIESKTIDVTATKKIPEKKRGKQSYSTGALHDSIDYKLEMLRKVDPKEISDGSGGAIGFTAGPMGDPSKFAKYKDPVTNESRAKRPPTEYGRYVDKGSRHFHNPVRFTRAGQEAVYKNFNRVMRNNWRGMRGTLQSTMKRYKKEVLQ